jgi:hypothetical protein
MACTPVLNWREVRPEGSGLTALFPCKPASHARRVALAGVQVEMALYACSADGTTYAVGIADVGQAQAVTPALDELAVAAVRNVAAAGLSAHAPLSIEGASPSTHAGRRGFAGQLPDGTRVQEQVALFARGTRVFQVTMIGARLDDQAIEAFFGGLRLAV